MKVAKTHGYPSQLVEAATHDKQKRDGDFDQYWCIFDVESPTPHPHLPNTLRVARAQGIQTAVSNPCFEIWLSLHFGEVTRYVTTGEAVKERARRDESSDKHVDFSRYTAKIPEAIARAKKLRAGHSRDGNSFPHDNPSSTMDLLVEELQRFSKRAQG